MRSIVLNPSSYSFYKRIKEYLYYKIVTHLSRINLYVRTLKSIVERLANKIDIRGYRLIYKNPRNYNPRIYNRSILDKIVIA